MELDESKITAIKQAMHDYNKMKELEQSQLQSNSREKENDIGSDEYHSSRRRQKHPGSNALPGNFSASNDLSQRQYRQAIML